MSTDPPPQHGPAPPDPSMEDILASIRRILDEEGAAPADPTAPPPQLDEPGEILELDHSMMLPEPDAAAPGPIPAPPPILAEPAPMTELPAMRDPAPEPPPVPAAVPLPPPPAPYPPLPELVAPAAAAAAAVSVGALLRTLATERSTAVHRGGPTIEDLVREEMRPLLKEWLDAHLPPMVERLVRAEIERVVSRMT